MSGSISIRGNRELQKKLTALGNSGPAVARAAVVAGCAVMAQACRDAATGTIKREVGFKVRTEGEKTVGKVGLMRFPTRGQRRGPHGVFVDQGTKYITPRRFIATALRSSAARARVAAGRAARRKIRSISNGK